jgi:lipopolysaccharide transport system ATP-binding protein
MTEKAKGSSPAIVVEHLTKIYRLYDRPQQRILDVLGVSRRSKFTEHFALDDVTFSVGRGERLAIIGRNGAGKSTLLKLVSGVTSPTSGTIKVEGTARALLEIGTGFHPEFTGRENAKAYFAQLGIAGRHAVELIDKVIDFSELEEYIDQPLKTYSTGMRLRLMFATATVVAPDMLVLDEVLGVGDAYFTRKSFDRINEISQREGATLLLVSHDIYTSARICNRMIWLEKGKVLFDGDPKDAVKAYEDSIRLQEEARLRSKSMLALQRDQDESKRPSEVVQVEVASPDGRPIDAPVWFGSVRLLERQNEVAALPLFAEPVTSSLDLEGTCWGDVCEWQGSPALQMKNFGSPFHKVGGTLIPPARRDDMTDLSVAFVWGADTPVDLMVSCRMGQHLVARQNVTIGGRQWERFELRLVHGADGGGTVEEPVERAAVFGTGRIYISGAKVLDAAGHETFNFWHGDGFRLLFDYEIRDPNLDENCDIAVSIQRGGVETACRVFTRSLHLSYADATRGTIEMKLDRLMLGAGAYSITVQIARNGYYDLEGHLFYTINPDVHAAVRQVVDFIVNTRGVVAESTSWVADGNWAIHPASIELSRNTLSG